MKTHSESSFIDIVFVAFSSEKRGGVKKKIDIQAKAIEANSRGSIAYVIGERGGVLRIAKRFVWELRLFFVVLSRRLSGNSFVLVVRESAPVGYTLAAIFAPKCVVEINGNLEDEWKKRWGLATQVFVWLRRKILKVSFTVSYNNLDMSRSRANLLLNNFSLVRPEAKRLNPRPKRLLMIISKNHPWHGIDLILELAQVLTDFEFVIVGELDQNSRSLENVKLTGYKETDEIVSLARDCGLGLGSMNYNNRGFVRNSAIKVSDYVALNLPVICNYHEYPGYGDCVLTLEGNFDLTKWSEQVRVFYHEWKDRSISVEQQQLVTVDSVMTRFISYAKTPLV